MCFPSVSLFTDIHLEKFLQSKTIAEKFPIIPLPLKSTKKGEKAIRKKENQ